MKRKLLQEKFYRNQVHRIYIKFENKDKKKDDFTLYTILR